MKYQFTIIHQTSELIELKSKYHYWRLIRIPGTELYNLGHKRALNHPYHKQSIGSKSPTLHNIYRYIQLHDEYVASNDIIF